MALVTGLYDHTLEDPIIEVAPGNLNFHSGYYDDQTKWSLVVQIPGQNNGGVFTVTLDPDHTDGLTISGGSVIWNARNKATIATQAPPLVTDTINDTSSTEIKNAFFLGKYNSGTEEEPVEDRLFIQMLVQPDTDPNSGLAGRISFNVGSYEQDPETGRETWTYSGAFSTQSNYHDFAENTQFGEVRLYRALLFGDLNPWYVFAFGVSGERINNTHFYSTQLFAIPQKIFIDGIGRPYVGEISKDTSADFVPVMPARDSIYSRDLTGKLDPYGFNTGNGLKLLEMSAAQQAAMVQWIYTGLSGNDLNALGQLVSDITGGNSHRPADEIKAMIDAVLCCHILPVINSGYTGTATTMQYLAGYKLFPVNVNVNQVTNQIVKVQTTPIEIGERRKDFLTYAPYCSVSLSIPFVGDIPIDTSAIFNSSIYFVFYLDLYSGTLSVDVHLIDSDGRDYIYTTRQTNCAVDIPIQGTGATSNPLQKIASAAGNVASGGVVGAVGAVYKTGDIISGQNSTAVGRGASSNIAPYFSQRHCYLVIEYPESANPTNFYDQLGGVSNERGTVGSFTGYTEFSAIDLSSVTTATEEEKREILAQLQGGVFL